jgi:hypothetical protein
VIRGLRFGEFRKGVSRLDPALIKNKQRGQVEEDNIKRVAHKVIEAKQP